MRWSVRVRQGPQSNMLDTVSVMKMKPDISQYLSELEYNAEEIEVILKCIIQLKKNRHFRDIKTNIQETLKKGAPLLVCYPDQIISTGKSSIKTLNRFIDRYFSNLPVYILPCWEATGDGGFSIKNFQKPRFPVGTIRDLNRFFKTRQTCIDMVFSNVSVDHIKVKNQLESPPTNSGFVAELINKNPNDIPKSHRGHPSVTEINSKFGKRWLWTTFSPNQVNLNYSSPKTLIWLLKTIAFYLDLGVSSIRLDAVPFTWTKETGPVLHAPQCHSLIKIVRGFIDYYKHGILLIAQSDYGLKPLHDYIGHQNNEAHLLYRHELAPLLIHAIISKQKRYLEKWIAGIANDPDRNWIIFLSTCDGVFLRPWDYPLPMEAIQMLVEACVLDGGVIQYYHWENHPPASLCATTYSLLHYETSHANTIKRLILAHAVLLALPGVPTLYFNSLLGMRNWSAWKKFEKESRSIVRECFSEKHINQVMSLVESTQYKLYKSIKILIDTRIKHPAFCQQSQVTLLAKLPNSILAWSIHNNNKTVLCYFNIGDLTEEIKMPDNSKYLVGEPIINRKIKLSPTSFSWIEQI